MKKEKLSYQTNLAKVKALGSAKSGTHHWWMQRLTAILLMPLMVWFSILAIKIVTSTNLELFDLFASPYNSMGIILFIITSLYHAFLGIKVVIEDYIHCPKMKLIMVIMLHITCWISGIAGLLAVLIYNVTIFGAL